MTKLDDQIAQTRRDLEGYPSGDDDGRVQALSNLADSFEDRFLDTNDIEDLEEVIGLHRTALALCPKGHPDRHSSLRWLAWCLVERYRKLGALPDLEEAIAFGRAARGTATAGRRTRHTSRGDTRTWLRTRVFIILSTTSSEEISKEAGIVLYHI